MPADSTAGPAEAAQPDTQNAAASTSAEATAGQEQTTTDNRDSKTEIRKSSAEAVMDHLDIPEGIRDQIRPQKSEDGAERSEDGGQKSEGPASTEATADSSGAAEGSTGEDEDADDDGEHEEDEQANGELPRDVRKLQKRVGRLTKKLRTAEKALEQFEAAQEAAQQQQGDQQQQPLAAPKGSGVLAGARTEAELDQMIALARATRQMVRDNPNGIAHGEGHDAKFHPPEDLQKWDASAQDILLEAEGRRRELREFRAVRTASDTEAKRIMPELFDRNSREFQAAVNLVNRFPELRQNPFANEALAYLVKGIKADQAAQSAAGDRRSEIGDRAGNGNGNGHKRAIDDRAFGPRVPIAPHTSGPSSSSSRNGLGGPANGASSKELKQATESLLADPDGGAGSLARVFGAMAGSKR